MKKQKYIIAAVGFLVVALAAIFVIKGVTSGGAKYADGTWTGTGAGRNGPVVVSLDIADGKIVNTSIVSEGETDFAKPAIEDVLEQIMKKNSASSFDAVSGATITSKATAEAAKNALLLASGKGKKEAAALKNESCDIVIIGAGGAGLCAAQEAHSLGKKVIVLEKMGIVGGNTNSATGGLNAAETKIQKGLGIEDTKDQYYNDTMKGGYELNDPDLVRRMVDKAPETVDWLISLGADLTDVGKMAGSTNNRTHRPQGGAPVGSHLVSVLESVVKTSGIDLRLNSKVTDILEKDGAACGVKVHTNDGDYEIAAKAVIVASGGFGANPDMVVSYKSNLAGFGTTNHKGATGDAFDMVKKFDAALVQMDQIQTHPTVVPGNGVMITEAVRGNGAIMVNREGKRFGNEMATRDVMSADILKQTGKTAYLLFDTDVRLSLKAIEGYIKQGLLTEGETLADLAGKLSIPADVLEESVNQYNSYQEAGNDPDFGRKGTEMPRALKTGPYFAVEVGPAIHHTMGGIKIDVDAQVISNSGKVIPGLFACGEVTGGVHGGNRLGGNAVADICVFGKIAADTACQYISK